MAGEDDVVVEETDDSYAELFIFLITRYLFYTTMGVCIYLIYKQKYFNICTVFLITSLRYHDKLVYSTI
jgi:hypothetical protein